jgi:hypothetical protein
MITSSRRRRTGRRHRGAALGTAGVFVAVSAGALGAVQLMPTRYAATSVVSFVPRPDSLANADTVQLIGQKYVVVATSGGVVDTAAAVSGLRVADLRPALKAELGAGTGNVSVTVTWADPVPAAAAANAVAGALVRAARPDRVVEGEQVAPAQPATAEVRPARRLLRVAGLIGALLSAAVTWSVITAQGRLRQPETLPVALR